MDDWWAYSYKHYSMLNYQEKDIYRSFQTFSSNASTASLDVEANFQNFGDQQSYQWYNRNTKHGEKLTYDSQTLTWVFETYNSEHDQTTISKSKLQGDREWGSVVSIIGSTRRKVKWMKEGEFQNIRHVGDFTPEKSYISSRRRHGHSETLFHDPLEEQIDGIMKNCNIDLIKDQIKALLDENTDKLSIHAFKELIIKALVRNKELEFQCYKLSDRLDRLSKELKDIEQAKADLENKYNRETSEMNHIICEQDQEISSLKKKYEKQLEDFESFKKNIDIDSNTLNFVISNLEKEIGIKQHFHPENVIEKIRDYYLRISKISEIYKQNMNYYKDEVLTKDSALRIAKDRENKMQEAIDEKDEEIKELKSRIEKNKMVLQKEINELKRDISDKDTQLEAAFKQIAILRLNIDNLLEELNQINLENAKKITIKAKSIEEELSKYSLYETQK